MEILQGKKTFFQKMDLDSLDIADLIVEIEKRTGKQVEYDELMKLARMEICTNSSAHLVMGRHDPRAKKCFCVHG